jgi:hypothetical protein
MLGDEEEAHLTTSQAPKYHVARASISLQVFFPIMTLSFPGSRDHTVF